MEGRKAVRNERQADFVIEREILFQILSTRALLHQALELQRKAAKESGPALEAIQPARLGEA